MHAKIYLFCSTSHHMCAHGSGNNTTTCPVKLNKLCFIGLGSRGNKQLAKITDEAQESEYLNPSSHDDLSDDSGKDPGCHGHWSEEPKELAKL